MEKSHKKTLKSAHVGYVVQAININFAPLLFITFHQTFDISLELISLLIAVNFITQLITDLIAALIMDKIGYKIPAVIAHFLAAIGLVLLGILPFIMSPFYGMMIAIILYAIGGGLLEVLLSPIVESVPSENKEKEMIKLFAFYSWGQVIVVLISVCFFAIFGISNWYYLAYIWALVPIINGIMFCFVKITPLINMKETKISTKELFKNKYFIVFLMIMFLTGAVEQGMSQWASTVAELGLGISKTLGDLIGPMFYAVMMGLTRIWYITFGQRVRLQKIMFFGGILAIIAFSLIAFSPIPILAIIGCGLCGIATGTLWPGAIRSAAKQIKNGGARMFGILALLGDIGCTSGPVLIGLVANKSDIRTGMIVGMVFAIPLSIFLFMNYKWSREIEVNSYEKTI